MLTLYLRREPTTDPTILRHVEPPRLRFWPDVVAYRDRAMTQPAARWSAAYSNQPTPGRKTVVFNCYR